MKNSFLFLFCLIVPLLSFGNSAQKGADLFQGKIHFKDGGVACISCHNVNSPMVISGGSLAKDLTYLGGEAGATVGFMVEKAENMPSPIMTEAYRGHELTQDERDALGAFFTKVNPSSNDKGLSSLFWVFGLLGAGGVFAGLIILGKKRVKNRSVNYELFARQLKTK